MSRVTQFRCSQLMPFILLLVASGCGSGRYPVTGRVTYEDGSPVDGGTVIGEATVGGKQVGVQGRIEKDGTFTLGADKPGDGALPGEYRIIITPVALGDSELAAGKRPGVSGKYGKYETSGLTFEVKPQKKNELNIIVTKPEPRSEEK